MPREQLQVLQLEKLQKLLARLDGTNRFYTRKWKEAGVNTAAIRSLADLSKLPFTTKTELMRSQEECPPFGTNLTFPEHHYTRLHQTSGTTGTPLRVLDTDESWRWWGQCWAHVMSGAGVTKDDRIMLAFSFGPFIGFWAAVEGAQQMGAMMIPSGGWDSVQRLQAMRDLSVTVVCCTPTYALRLAEIARDEHFDLKALPVRALIHAGEPGANVPRTKQRIQSEWGAKCFDHGGASEVGAHSFECELQPGGTHVIETEFIVEVLDSESGRTVNPGETGELVITNLGRPGFPVIRYRTGDLVRLNVAPCACGRTFARFDGGLLGRADDMVTIRGVNIYPTAIENVVRQFASVDEFCVMVTTKRQMQDLEIQIEVGGEDNAEQVRSRVEQAVHHAISLRPTVTLAPRGTLVRDTGGKARRFRRLDAS